MMIQHKKKLLLLLVIYLISTFLSFGISNCLVFGRFWIDGHAYPPLLVALLASTVLSYFLTQHNRILPSTQVAQLIFRLLEYLFLMMFFSLTYWFIISSKNYTTGGIALFFIINFFLLLVKIKLLINQWRKNQKKSESIYSTVIGQSNYANELKEQIGIHKWIGYELVDSLGLKDLGKEELEELILEHQIRAIFLDIDNTSLNRKDLDLYQSLSENHMVRFYAFSQTLSGSFVSRSYLLIGDIQCVSLFNYPLDKNFNQFIKRVFDIFFSLAVILLALSWLTPLMCLSIVIDSGLPFFFKQERIGLSGKSFSMIKFRSMVPNRNSNSVPTQKGDSRITRLGRFIRKTSIDELPQFFNVLIGDMSIVGPRPHMSSENKFYEDVISRYLMRHFVKPGITGLAQVKGYRGIIRSNRDMEKRINADSEYIRKWRFSLDIYIIFRTIVNILKGDKNAV